MIDLHCHSSFSDGALSPEELIQRAQDLHLSCLSLTDHDTVAGLEVLAQAARTTPIKIINGIELSTRWKKQEVHLLGYRFHYTCDLDALIQKQNQNRIERALQIGDALSQMGIERAYQKACEVAGHDRVGRPHFARVLVNEGKVRDMKAAFKQFLGRGKGAYVAAPWITLQEAIEGITKAGGQAVLAHPLKYGLTRSKLHELIAEFKEVGGEGLEVISGMMTTTQVKEMAAICLRFDLLASSGSDFHNDSLPRVNLGQQRPLPENCKPIWYDWNIEQGTI